MNEEDGRVFQPCPETTIDR